MNANLLSINRPLRLVVVHAPDEEQRLMSFARVLYELPRAANLRIIPLCQRGQLLGLWPRINSFMLGQADAVVFLSRPRDLEQLEQLRLAKATHGHERTMVCEVSDRFAGAADFQKFASRLVDRLFPTPIHDVLCMFACPDEHEQLALHREWRAIDDVNDRAGKPLAIEACWATRVSDLQNALLERPRDLVHFSGHGEPGGVVFETADGYAHPVATGRLIRMLAEHRPRCLVFNACHTADMLTTLSRHDPAPHVIAMQGTTADRASIEFSRAFYAALAYGRSVRQAFDHAFVGLGLHGHSEQCRPRLLN
jgi:hypothetical protein